MAVLLLLGLLIVGETDHDAERASAIEKYRDRVAETIEKSKRDAPMRLERAVKSAQTTITRVRQGVVDPQAPGVLTPANYRGRITYPSVASKQKALKAAEEKLDKARADLALVRSGRYEPETPRFSLISDELEVGQIGHAPESCLVKQVVDKSNVLLSLGNFPFRAKGSDGLVWAKLSTDGVVDGREMKLSGLFWVSGTRTYETALGSHTVFVIESVGELLPIADKP